MVPALSARAAFDARRRCFFDLATKIVYQSRTKIAGKHKTASVDWAIEAIEQQAFLSDRFFPVPASPRHERCNLPKASPTLPSSVLSPVGPSSPHSQSGYSESSFATSPSWPLRYPSPLSSVPAGALLGGRPGVLDAALGVVLGDEGIPGVFAGDGVKGVEKGCAAEVDVARGGLSGWRSLEVVERGRRIVVLGDDGERRRIQR